MRAILSLFLMLSLTTLISAKQIKKTRVASLALVTDEILIDMNLPKNKYNIVLLSHFSKNKLYSNIKTKGIPTFHGSLEELIKSKPDIVLYAAFNRPSVKKYVQNQKFKAVMLEDFKNVKSIQKNIELIADVLNYPAGSKNILKDVIIKPCSVTSGGFVLTYSENLVFSGKKSLLNDLLSKANFGYLPAQEISGAYGKITEEKLISLKPDFMLLEKNQKIKNSGSWHYILKKKLPEIHVPKKILSSVNHHALKLIPLLCDYVEQKAQQKNRVHQK